MELLPLVTVLGPADKVTVGAGVVTETVADWVALPPLPVMAWVVLTCTAVWLLKLPSMAEPMTTDWGPVVAVV